MHNDDAFEFQTGLIAQSIEKIEMNFLLAVDRGAVDPVVLLLDLRDDRARAIVGRIGGDDQADRMLAGSAGLDMAPTVMVGLPRPVAAEMVEGLIPEFETTLASMATGDGYVVVAVARGGAVMVALPAISA